MSNKISTAIKFALDLAQELPDKYQVAAFAELLRYELSKTSVQQLNRIRPTHTPAEVETTNRGEAMGLPEPHVVAEMDNRDAETVWAVLSLTQRGVEAHNDTIRDEVEIALGVRPQARQNTNRTLRRLVPKYLVRKKKGQGKGYVYVPSPRALGIFDQQGDTN